MTKIQEGYIPFKGFRTWYKTVGECSGNKRPLLCLHGGPGFSHDYFEPFEALADSGRQVIFYDQLGNGRSDHIDDPDMWTVELFVEEVGVVREALSLDQVHLLGQSWGGMLAMEYMLTQPKGVVSLILSNTLPSAQLWKEESDRLRSELPPDVLAMLVKHEEAGTTYGPEYEAALNVYYQRHLCRITPMPDCLQRSFDVMTHNPQVYNVLWGPNEFQSTGKLKDWDITNRLGEITTPTLVLNGRHDEATPRIAETIHNGIPNSEWTIFENSSHLPNLEEPGLYLMALDDFLIKKENDK